jgi:hypothetical protein
MTTEDKFYTGWAIRIAQTSTFQQAAEHLKQFAIEVLQRQNTMTTPTQNLIPAQEKLCEQWSARFGLNQTQHYHGFARELLALREPAPQADELRDCRGLFDLKEGKSLLFAIETMRGYNAELRRKLETAAIELKQADQALQYAGSCRKEWADSTMRLTSERDELRRKLEELQKRNDVQRECFEHIGNQLGLVHSEPDPAVERIYEAITKLQQPRAWVPVSTPPTEADADHFGRVAWLTPTNSFLTNWDWDREGYSDDVTHWHGLAKLPPAPSKADADEAAFEAWLKNGVLGDVTPARAAWQAALKHAREGK